MFSFILPMLNLSVLALVFLSIETFRSGWLKKCDTQCVFIFVIYLLVKFLVCPIISTHQMLWCFVCSVLNYVACSCINKTSYNCIKIWRKCTEITSLHITSRPSNYIFLAYCGVSIKYIALRIKSNDYVLFLNYLTWKSHTSDDKLHLDSQMFIPPLWICRISWFHLVNWEI